MLATSTSVYFLFHHLNDLSENTLNRREKTRLLCHKTAAALELVVVGRASSCPVVFPDLKVYLDKSCTGLLVVHWRISGANKNLSWDL